MRRFEPVLFGALLAATFAASDAINGRPADPVRALITAVLGAVAWRYLPGWQARRIANRRLPAAEREAVVPTWLVAIIVVFSTLLLWIIAISDTDTWACAPPSEGGSLHGPATGLAAAFCESPAAATAATALVYFLAAAVPLAALFGGLTAAIRLTGRRRTIVTTCCAFAAPGGVLLAWLLAGARW